VSLRGPPFSSTGVVPPYLSGFDTFQLSQNAMPLFFWRTLAPVTPQDTVRSPLSQLWLIPGSIRAFSSFYSYARSFAVVVFSHRGPSRIPSFSFSGPPLFWFGGPLLGRQTLPTRILPFFFEHSRAEALIHYSGLSPHPVSPGFSNFLYAAELAPSFCSPVRPFLNVLFTSVGFNCLGECLSFPFSLTKLDFQLFARCISPTFKQVCPVFPVYLFFFSGRTTPFLASPAGFLFLFHLKGGSSTTLFAGFPLLPLGPPFGCRSPTTPGAGLPRFFFPSLQTPYGPSFFVAHYLRRPVFSATCKVS